jgi:hypothetical protein
MGFFDTLKRVLPHASHAHIEEDAQKRIRSAWGLEEEQSTSESAHEPDLPAGQLGVEASGYDRAQWTKRLRKLLDELPTSQSQWHDLITDAHALNLEESWVSDHQREEFTFLVRRAVADRVVSEEEHHKIELARKLIGMSEPEAEQILHSITAEAEAFFGKPVRDDA